MAEQVDGSVDSKGAKPKPNPEVVARAKRRTFGAAYKRRILDEIDALDEEGGIGKLLRREGLYSSHLTKWRREREKGLEPKKRGRKPTAEGHLVEENRRLTSENERLRKQLTQAEAIIDIQKKISTLLTGPIMTTSLNGGSAS
jgi:transposase-like protein